MTGLVIGVFSSSIWIFPPFGDIINPNGPFWNNTKGPFGYPEYEVFLDPHLHDEVTVYRDEFGVPHIYAKDYRDLYYVFGYLQASDRYFEMTLLKLLGYGRLSEVAGSLTIDIDKYMKTISLWKSAEDLIEIATENKEKYKDPYNILEEFTLGANKWIKTHGHEMPVEFALLDLPIEEWSMLDTALVANLAGFMLSWVTEDLQMEELRLVLGPYLKAHPEYGTSLNELFPTWNMTYPYETPIIPENTSIYLSGEDNSHGIYTPQLLNTINRLTNIEDSLLNSLGDSMLRVLFEPLFRRFEWGIGSNNWVINGSLSNTGKPILCGDPHLMLMAPSVWYEAHLVCTEEGTQTIENPQSPGTYVTYKRAVNSYGVAFPGVPTILIGHNEHCAWSETNVGSDAFIDYYAEELNSEESQYKYQGQWHDIEVIEKPIKVKLGDLYYEEPYNVRYTRHGPIITDILGDTILGGGSEAVTEEYDHISLRYIGYENNDEYNQLIAYVLLNRAENVYDIKQALEFYPNPPQNFVVADDSGNIGMISAGFFPVRGKYNEITSQWEVRPEYDGRYIQPGDGSGQEWRGFVPPEHIPHSINPKTQMYLASANQRTIASDIYNYSIGDSWAPGWRARSINRYLNTSNPDSPYHSRKISFEDMQNIQYSDYDIAAQEYLPVILDAYDGLTTDQKSAYSEEFKEAITELREWNNSDQYRYHMNKYLIAPTIFEKWMQLLPSNIWGDEWNEAYEAAKFDTTGHYPHAQITEYWIMNKAEDDDFFDDQETDSVETKTDILLQTLEDAVEVLHEKYGPLDNDWIWGNHHQLALLSAPLFGSILAGNDPKSWPIHGSGRVLNNAPVINFEINQGPIHFDAGEYVFGGPSWRQVIDFTNIKDRSVGVLPAGISGDPLNPHFTDQVDMWVDGNYKTLLFHEDTDQWIDDEISAIQEWYAWDY